MLRLENIIYRSIHSTITCYRCNCNRILLAICMYIHILLHMRNIKVRANHAQSYILRLYITMYYTYLQCVCSMRTLDSHHCCFVPIFSGKSKTVVLVSYIFMLEHHQRGQCAAAAERVVILAVGEPAS